MMTNGTPSESRFVSLVLETLTSLAIDIRDVGVQTPLIGGEAIVDSIGFITLLIGLEQGVNNRIDLSASFMDHGAEDGPANPFRTVGSLAAHLEALLSAAPRVSPTVDCA